MSKRWMRCEISKGMFSDEVVVAITVKGGETASFFVPKTEVREDQKTVRVLIDDSHSWAVLPNEAQTLVPVDKSDLVVAA